MEQKTAEETSIRTDEYQVGRLTEFEGKDPIFDDYVKAVTNALKQNEDGSPIGVWIAATGELVTIVHHDQQFKA